MDLEVRVCILASNEYMSICAFVKPMHASTTWSNFTEMPLGKQSVTPSRDILYYRTELLYSRPQFLARISLF